MTYELVIIGGGITGIKAAIKAHEMGLKDVIITDHNAQSGGFYSSLFQRDEYREEKALVDQFKKLPYEKWTQSTAIGLFEAFTGGEHELNIQTPVDTKDIKAQKVIIASGALEKPREAHKISGTRPSGVMTSLMAMGLLERGYIPGKKTTVFVNSKASHSLAEEMSSKGIAVKTIDPNDYSLHAVHGHAHLTGIDIKHRKNGLVESTPCDSLIFSEGYIPSTFFLKGSGIELDQQFFIHIDEKGQTSVDGILAFGTCTTFPYMSDDQIEENLAQFLKEGGINT
ncbi:FAD-dependent oxidoreductase [Bacillaceae bacterium SIJ1]|uniref:FAD-dependent oxidoreductase n=1 Tax=Litoribacterium kuwaitense TaxID=1398745 RepID=UPI0013EB395C|nr:FAD-dependent oxidoreductase [Litoribacterium kuwaitense]NGP45383.1 FAD-dependent oxidoreductase [Litoribacterium kuwaitense]